MAMYSEYEPLVLRIARNFAHALPELSPITFDDLCQVGRIGLLQAIERFDPTLGHKFRSLAYCRIKGAIQDEMRACDHVPRSERKKERADDSFKVCEIVHLDCTNETLLANIEQSPFELLVKTEIEGAASVLPERQKKVFILRYIDGMTFKEIGKELNVTETRAFQIHDQVIANIRKKVA